MGGRDRGDLLGLGLGLGLARDVKGKQRKTCNCWDAGSVLLFSRYHGGDTCYRVPAGVVELNAGHHVCMPHALLLHTHTLTLQAVGINACNRAYWRGDAKKESLQRVYAITFPDPKQLKEYKHRIEEVSGRRRQEGKGRVGGRRGGGGAGRRQRCRAGNIAMATL